MNEFTKGRLILRELRLSDKARLCELCNNKKIHDNLRDIIPFPYTETDAENFIRICNDENPISSFAIQYNEEFVGCISLVKQADIYRLGAELGYWIGEPYWGLGIATEAVNEIVEYGFNQLKMVRIFSGVFDYNKSSQRVLEKAGFKLEGIFEKSVYKNGNIYDEYRYAKTRKN